MARETQLAVTLSEKRLLLELLPVVDSFERCLASSYASVEEFHNGVVLIHKQCLEALRKAGVEDLDVKKELFSDLDRITGDHAILATNTSTLPVIEMAMKTGRPEQVCGIHFFNPAPVMALVEVVRPLTASDETIAEARRFAEACGKTPVEVKDQAGFIVNALLFPYLNNAIRLLEQGVASVADIDAAMKGGCGFPMGPFALLDLVGLDTSLAILDALYEEFKDPNYAAVPLLRRMVTAEQLGRKSGHGFLDYRK